MKLKTLPFLAFIICSNIYAQLNLDELSVINDNFKTSDYVLADIDNDGYNDLVSAGSICGRTGGKRSAIVWQKNDNSGNFGTRIILSDVSSSEIDAKDIDNDGDNDIVFSFSDKVGVIKNNDDGTFSAQEDYPLYSDDISNLILIDMNDDTWIDMVYRDRYEKIRVKLNSTNGQFGTNDILVGSSDNGYDNSYKVLDINNDKLPDFVFDNEKYLDFRLNKGGMMFSVIQSFYTNHSGYLGDFDLADFNGDGQKDLVFSNQENVVKIYYNQSITDSNSLYDLNNSMEVFSGLDNVNIEIEIADFNNDEFPDIAITESSNNKILENNKNQGFIEHELSSKLSFLDAQDLNKDGLIDIFSSDQNYKTAYFNKGGFDFQFENYSSIPLKHVHTIGDINNDDLKDIISYSYVAAAGYSVQYLINKGNNNFSRKTLNLNTSYVPINTDLEPLLFDMDNDNLKDLVFFGKSYRNAEIFWVKNLGKDTFASKINSIEAGFYALDKDKVKMFYGDFDNDNDNDLFLSYKFFENINGAFKAAKIFDTDGHIAQHIFNSDDNKVINIIGTKVFKDNFITKLSIKRFKYNTQGELMDTKRILNSDMNNYSDETNVSNFAFKDFDNDNLKDIVYSLSEEGILAIKEFFMSKNYGNDYFANPEVLIPRDSFIREGRDGSFDIIDIDKDNDLDIIETAYKEKSSYDTTESVIHYNNGGEFSKTNTESLYKYWVQDKCEELPIEISIEDMDNDGILDFVKCNAYEYLIGDLSYLDTSLSTSELELESKFILSPNPTSDYLNIQSKSNIELLSLYNQKGQLILKKKNTRKINLSNLSVGFYFLKIKDENGATQTKKIVKE